MEMDSLGNLDVNGYVEDRDSVLDSSHHIKYTGSWFHPAT
jgi:hypothetical protein